MVLALEVFLYEVCQQLLEQPRGIIKAALQGHHGERGYGATVTHGEAALGLQCMDEGEQEGATMQQLPEKAQGLLDIGGSLWGTGSIRGGRPWGVGQGVGRQDGDSRPAP